MTDEVYKSKTTKKKKSSFFFFPFLFCNCSASLIWSMHCTEVNVSARPLSTLTPCDSELSGLLLLAAGGSVRKRLTHQDLVNFCTRRVDKRGKQNHRGLCGTSAGFSQPLTFCVWRTRSKFQKTAVLKNCKTCSRDSPVSCTRTVSSLQRSGETQTIFGFVFPNFLGQILIPTFYIFTLIRTHLLC